VKFITIPITITIPVERINSGKRKTKSERFPARKDSGNKKEFRMHYSIFLRTFPEKEGQIRVTAEVLFYIKG